LVASGLIIEKVRSIAMCLIPWGFYREFGPLNSRLRPAKQGGRQ
jgi:hypothetical protein